MSGSSGSSAHANVSSPPRRGDQLRRRVYGVRYKTPGGGGSAAFYGTRVAVREAVALLWPNAEIESLEPWDGDGDAHDARALIRALLRGKRFGCLVDHLIAVSGGRPVRS